MVFPTWEAPQNPSTPSPALTADACGRPSLGTWQFEPRLAQHHRYKESKQRWYNHNILLVYIYIIYILYNNNNYYYHYYY
jgi:hypothetical protein